MAIENLTRDEARERSRLLNVASYDVHLDLTLAADEPLLFTSTSTIEFTCTEPGTTTHLDITADSIVSASLNGTPIDVESGFTGQRLAVPGLAESNELHVVARCTFSRTGEGLHRFVDPVDKYTYLYTQFETFDAHRMFACFDQPDLKSTFTFVVDAPESWQVFSNMPATHHGERWVFEPTPRQSTYITAIVAGPYVGATDTHDGIPLGVYCRHSMVEHLDAKDIIEITKTGFDAYHRLFDFRYPWPKYDQIFVPEFNMGAMENAGCVTITDDYVFRSRMTDAAIARRAVTVLHELAHMWFGDLVTMSWWDDLWLNESFAEFASTWVTAEHTRWNNAWTDFCTSEKTWAYRQDQLPTTHPIAADIPDIEAVTTNFDGITYAKGASVLKQLAHWVGAAEFFEATRAYFAEHAYRNTTLQDLLDALENASGRNLSDWTKEWLQTAGVNTLRPEFEVDSDGRYTAFRVVQQAPEEHATLRSHRLRVGLYHLGDKGLLRRHQLELDVSGPSTDVPALIGHEQPDLLLLNDDDLTYAKIRFDDRSWQTLVDSVAALRDPLARAMCWTSAWDMTRDAEQSAGDFLDIVLGCVAQESEILTVQTLLVRARQVIEPFGNPARRDTRLAHLADQCFALLDSSRAGSDHQLAFARAAAVNAVTDAQLDRVAALLDGSNSLDGLAVDTELRWTLLQALVSNGRAGDAEITAELERDDTARGKRHALTLRAARPTAEAKAEAWRLIVEGDELPNADQRAVIIGFQQFGQQEILAPYVEKYFEAVAGIYEHRSAEMAQHLIEGLYPATIAVQATVDTTDEFIARHRPGPALRRMLVESRDSLARALRVQAADA